MHRPGPELQRLTPRHRDRVLLRTLPWLGRARQEHDVLSQVLRDEGAEVLYLMQLLQDCLEYQSARDEAIGLAVADAGLGDELRGQLRGQLEDLAPESLAAGPRSRSYARGAEARVTASSSSCSTGTTSSWIRCPT